MTQILRPDFCVIGGGCGGLAAARAAVGLGAKVAVVEKRPLGALEPLRGAWQTYLFAAAAARFVAQHAGGVKSAATDTDLRHDLIRLRRESEVAAARLARMDSLVRLTGLNIKVIQATGHFTGPRRFDAGDAIIEAKRFLLALGSHSIAPQIAGLELVRPLTPDRIAELPATPKRIAAIGTSPENLMLIQAFLRYGSKVVLLQSGSFLPQEDPELAAPLLAALRREGLETVDQAVVRGIELSGAGPQGAGFRISLADDRTVDATHLIYAPERAPRVEGLGLKAARVAYSKDAIKLNAEGRSSNRRIYVIRDDCDSLQAIETARREGQWIAERLFGERPPRRAPRARVIPTDPELAVVGLSEAEARTKCRTIRILRAGFGDNLRAQLSAPAGAAITGHVKIITDAQDRILGAGVLGPQARELIGPLGLALAQGLKGRDLAALAVSEPTLIEICGTAALASAPQTGKVSSWRIGSAWRSR